MRQLKVNTACVLYVCECTVGYCAKWEQRSNRNGLRWRILSIGVARLWVGFYHGCCGGLASVSGSTLGSANSRWSSEFYCLKNQSNGLWIHALRLRERWPRNGQSPKIWRHSTGPWTVLRHQNHRLEDWGLRIQRSASSLTIPIPSARIRTDQSAPWSSTITGRGVGQTRARRQGAASLWTYEFSTVYVVSTH